MCAKNSTHSHSLLQLDKAYCSSHCFVQNWGTELLKDLPPPKKKNKNKYKNTSSKEQTIIWI